MSRFTRIVLLGGFVLAALPATASAQFSPSYAPPNPAFNPPWAPFQMTAGMSRPTTFGRAYLGMSIPHPLGSPQLSLNVLVPPDFSASAWRGPAWSNSAWNSGSGSAAMRPANTFGGAARNDAFFVAQRELERAQREASQKIRSNPETAKEKIYDLWAFERLGVLGVASLKGGTVTPAELAKALAVTDEADVASGEALNHVLVGVVAAEEKGGKGPSAFLPPQLLDTVRFTGPPAAEAINLLRQSGKLPFPDTFDDGRLKDTRDALEKDFAAAAAPLLAGKAADRAALARLEATVQKAQNAITPVIKDMGFADATAARRFLNQLENVVGVMKSNNAAALVNPAWTTDGTTVADLVKHVTKNKLLFAPAPTGGDAAYLALHKGLATYLLTITAPKK